MKHLHAFHGAHLGACACLLLLFGCFGGGTPLEVRRVRPVLPETNDTPPPVGECFDLHLEPVRSSTALGEPVCWTRADGRTGCYEDLRWQDLPATVIERSLSMALFAEGWCRRVRRGDAPELIIELVAFGERSDSHEVEIEFAWQLWLDDAAQDHALRVQVPLREAGDAGLAQAMGQAVREACRSLRDDLLVLLHLAAENG
ncbi:MAG: membrane integrity-associated transporter subunit PqiC [Planctomycetes bacterium]|nr:membrane integrity-associated transporter subunit PqiC [Planctomycetota bacterium]